MNQDRRQKPMATKASKGQGTGAKKGKKKGKKKSKGK